MKRKAYSSIRHSNHQHIRKYTVGDIGTDMTSSHLIPIRISFKMCDKESELHRWFCFKCNVTRLRSDGRENATVVLSQRFQWSF